MSVELAGKGGAGAADGLNGRAFKVNVRHQHIAAREVVRYGEELLDGRNRRHRGGI